MQLELKTTILKSQSHSLSTELIKYREEYPK